MTGRAALAAATLAALAWAGVMAHGLVTEAARVLVLVGGG